MKRHEIPEELKDYDTRAQRKLAPHQADIERRDNRRQAVRRVAVASGILAVTGVLGAAIFSADTEPNLTKAQAAAQAQQRYDRTLQAAKPTEIFALQFVTPTHISVRASVGQHYEFTFGSDCLLGTDYDTTASTPATVTNAPRTDLLAVHPAQGSPTPQSYPLHFSGMLGNSVLLPFRDQDNSQTVETLADHNCPTSPRVTVAAANNHDAFTDVWVAN